ACCTSAATPRRPGSSRPRPSKSRRPRPRRHRRCCCWPPAAATGWDGCGGPRPAPTGGPWGGTGGAGTGGASARAGGWWGGRVVRLWDVAAGRPAGALRGHEGEVTAVTFSPDGALVASASWDATAKLWEPATGRECGVLRGHKGAITAVAFSPDGRLVATG